MKKLLATSLLVLSSLAFAQEAPQEIEHVSGEPLDYTITATNPTENVDGTPLTDLTKLSLYACSGEGCTPGGDALQDYPTTEPGGTVVMARSFNPEGDVGTLLVVRYAATAWDSENNESALSGIVEKRIRFVEQPTNPPNPPGIAPVGDSAYIIVQSEDALILLDIGQVAVETTCDSQTSITDDNGITAWKIPTSAVTPYNASQQMIVVFSRCGN